MKKADVSLVSALVQLEGDASYGIYKSWLQDSFIARLTDNIDLTGEAATRGQGYAEALRDILRVMKDPRIVREKLEKSIR